MSMLTNDLVSYNASNFLIEVIKTTDTTALVLEFNHSVVVSYSKMVIQL